MWLLGQLLSMLQEGEGFPGARCERRGLRRSPRRRWIALAALAVVTPAPVWAVGFPPPAGAAGATVTVQLGQTLSSIAARYDTTVAALAAANGIRDPDRIMAGTVLNLPGATASASAAEGSVTRVVVRRGETLTGIAAAYHTTVTILQRANGLADPDYIRAGDNLIVPSAAVVAGTLPQPANAAASFGSDLSLASFTVPMGGGAGLPTGLLAHPDRLWLQPVFSREASAHGVPVSLLEALCWWESGWQAAIVSRTGAIGVCQIEPSTADFVNTVLGTGHLDPHVAAQNVELGAAYLSSLLRATQGDAGLAVAAYYQGLTSVRRHGVLPQTAQYVRGIEAYTAIFAG